MTLEAAVDPHVAVVDLAVVALDQVAQRLDPVDVLVAETQIIEPLLAAGLPDRVQLGDHPFFAQRLMHLGLQPGAQPGELRPVADRLAQLAHLRWGDPRLRQPPHPQQIGQQRGITMSFFTRRFS